MARWGLEPFLAPERLRPGGAAGAAANAPAAVDPLLRHSYGFLVALYLTVEGGKPHLRVGVGMRAKPEN